MGAAILPAAAEETATHSEGVPEGRGDTTGPARVRIAVAVPPAWDLEAGVDVQVGGAAAVGGDKQVASLKTRWEHCNEANVRKPKAQVHLGDRSYRLRVLLRALAHRRPTIRC